MTQSTTPTHNLTQGQETLLEIARQREAGKLNNSEVPKQYEVMELAPENTVPYENIRDYDPEHIQNLAASIITHGQLQESVGIISEGKIVVIAGKHRRLAIMEINKVLSVLSLPPMIFRVRVYNGNLSKEEIFEIQLAENLQKQMTPTEKADTLYTIWIMYLEAYGSEIGSFEDLARRSGQSAESISAAVRFGKIDRKVAQLARDKKLPFSVAVAISGIKQKDQFQVANHVIAANLSKDVALAHIASLTKKDKGTNVGLFGAVTEALMAEEAIKMGVERTMGEKASAASDYFGRILYILSRYSDKGNSLHKIVFTTNVVCILRSLIHCSEEFRAILDEKYPEVAKSFDLEKIPT